MKALVAIADSLAKLRALPLLWFRLYLAYGFWGPFLNKAKDPAAFAGFLAKMDYPIPEVSAWIAMITEGAGILFLVFGFATRLITLPLMFLLCVAIFTVHISHGYNVCEGGWELPFTYLMLLFGLVILGPGEISVDALLAKGKHKE